MNSSAFCVEVMIPLAFSGWFVPLSWGDAFCCFFLLKKRPWLYVRNEFYDILRMYSLYSNFFKFVKTHHLLGHKKFFFQPEMQRICLQPPGKGKHQPFGCSQEEAEESGGKVPTKSRCFIMGCVFLGGGGWPCKGCEFVVDTVNIKMEKLRNMSMWYPFLGAYHILYLWEEEHHVLSLSYL